MLFWQRKVNSTLFSLKSVFFEHRSGWNHSGQNYPIQIGPPLSHLPYIGFFQLLLGHLSEIRMPSVRFSLLVSICEFICSRKHRFSKEPQQKRYFLSHSQWIIHFVVTTDHNVEFNCLLTIPMKYASDKKLGSYQKWCVRLFRIIQYIELTHAGCITLHNS